MTHQPWRPLYSLRNPLTTFMKSEVTYFEIRTPTKLLCGAGNFNFHQMTVHKMYQQDKPNRLQNLRKDKLSLVLNTACRPYVWRSGITAPCILNFGTRWRWVLSLRRRPIYPRGRSPLDRRLCGRCDEARNSTGNQIRTVDRRKYPTTPYWKAALFLTWQCQGYELRCISGEQHASCPSSLGCGTRYWETHEVE